MKYVEFMKKVVPLHDDLFDFFYEALPGYEEVGRRRILLGCWGSFQNPDVCDYTYKNMTKWGRAMYVTPGVVVDGKLVTTDLVDINLGIRILLGSSYYDDWENGETFVKHDPLGNPVDKRHPWNQTTIPKPQKRDFKGKYTWVMSPRWYDKRTKDHLALDTGGGPIARLWATALAGLVDIGYIKATGQSVKIYLPKTASRCPRSSSSGRFPSGATPSSATGRGPTSRRTPPRRPLLRRAGAQGAARRPHQDLDRIQGPRRGDRLRLPRGGARRAVAPRRDPRAARSPTTTPIRRPPGTPTRATSTARPGPTKTPCRTRRSSRRTAPTSSRGSTSCAPCAASTRACPAASTCTWATARCWKSGTRPMFGVQRTADNDRRRRSIVSNDSEDNGIPAAHRTNRDADRGPREAARSRRAGRRPELVQAILELPRRWLCARLSSHRRRRRAGRALLERSPRRPGRACSCCTGFIPTTWPVRSNRRSIGAALPPQSHGGDVELLGIDERGRPACGCREAATAALRRRRHSRTRSKRRSSRPPPTSRRSRSRA